MSKSRALATFTLIPLAGIIILAGCNPRKPAAEPEQEVSVTTPVTITPVSIGPVAEYLELPATTTYLNKSIVRSTTAGTIENVSFVAGGLVKKNDLLCTIRTKESSALNSTMRTDSILSFNGRINIHAVRDGVISEISHQTGDYVQEGDELAVISDLSSLVFILDSPLEYIKYIERSNQCTIKLADNQTIAGTISGKLPEMDIQAQTVKYIIRTSVPGQFPANLNAIVRIAKSIKKEALTLPKDAVLSNETQSEFWVMKLISDSVAVKVNVRKGYENNELVEITDPVFLRSDRIVLNGGYGLPDTAKVIIKKDRDE